MIVFDLPWFIWGPLAALITVVALRPWRREDGRARKSIGGPEGLIQIEKWRSRR